MLKQVRNLGVLGNKAKASVGVTQAQVIGKTWQKLKYALSCLSIFRGQTWRFGRKLNGSGQVFGSYHNFFDRNQLRHFNLFLLVHSIVIILLVIHFLMCQSFRQLAQIHRLPVVLEQLHATKIVGDDASTARGTRSHPSQKPHLDEVDDLPNPAQSPR